MARLTTIATNIKQNVTNKGLFLFRAPYRIDAPIKNGPKHKNINNIHLFICLPIRKLFLSVHNNNINLCTTAVAERRNRLRKSFYF